MENNNLLRVKVYVTIDSVNPVGGRLQLSQELDVPPPISLATAATLLLAIADVCEHVHGLKPDEATT